jgi:hypothetical protein
VIPTTGSAAQAAEVRGEERVRVTAQRVTGGHLEASEPEVRVVVRMYLFAWNDVQHSFACQETFGSAAGIIKGSAT